MFSNGDDPCAINILHFRKFEPHSMRLWCQLAREATKILDIGANVGVYSLTAAAIRTDIPIFAFEPNPHAYGRVRINKMKNGFKNIHEVHAAVGHEDTLADFSWILRDTGQISSGGGLGTHEGRNDVERTVVRMMKIDKMPVARELGPRGLVKVDVEGAELAVFTGMRETIANHKPDIILETFHAPTCDRINDMVLPLGYSVFLIDEAGYLTETGRLMPALRNSSNFNQFLTTRPEAVRTP